MQHQNYNLQAFLKHVSNTIIIIVSVEKIIYYDSSYYSPVVDPMVVTSTVISVDDGLLRYNASCANSSFLLTSYVDWLNITVTSIT